MKKLLCLVISLALALCLASCGNDVPEVDPGLNVDDDGGINLPVIDYQPPTE